MWILLGIVVAVIFALFLCTKGNCDKQKQARLRGFCYAHRGLHGKGVAENSMAAFAAAKEKGVKFGAKRKDVPMEFQKYKQAWENGEISLRKAARCLNISHTTFYRRCKE